MHLHFLEESGSSKLKDSIKAHPWLTNSEKEQICRLMDFHKHSLEVCTHATQNERLTFRVVAQLLFFEKL